MVEALLRELGHDVLAVRDLDASMPDRDILRMAVAENRLLVTMDKDFGELVYREDRKHTGVLLLHMEDATGGEKAQVVRHILERQGNSLLGRFSVYQGGYLRTRATAGPMGR